jgi:PAS domain S-box-containing protein
MKVKRGPLISPFLVAVFCPALATVATCLWPTLYHIHSLALFMIGVVITAAYGGLWPSVLAIVCSTLAFAYFIAPPAGWAISDPQDKVRLASFIVVAFLFSFLHSARVNAECRARSMVQRLSMVLEGTKFGVWDLDLRSGVVWHSPSLEEIFGRGPERFARSYEVFLGYVCPEDRDLVHRTVTQTIESNSEFHLQYRVTLPDGELRYVWTRGRIFRDAKGNPERLVAATADVTPETTMLPTRSPVPVAAGAA